MLVDMNKKKSVKKNVLVNMLTQLKVVFVVIHVTLNSWMNQMLNGVWRTTNVNKSKQRYIIQKQDFNVSIIVVINL